MAERVLLIGHVSGVAAAAERLARAEVDLLTYGRAPEGTPLPAVARVVALPAPRPVPAARLVLGLRRARYDRCVVAQPRLGVSRARGALLGMAVASGARRIVAQDPDAGASIPLPRRRAAADAVRFAVLQLAAHGLARLATPLLRAATRTRAPAAEPPATGGVVYLRTDLELALAPVTAGGSLAHTEGILLALERRGHAPELWATGEMAGMPASVPRRRLPAVLRANLPWEVAELASGLVQAARAPRPAVPPAFVYQRYSLNNLAGVLLARRWRVPLVLEANASEVAWRERWSTLQFPALARASERLVLSAADRVAAVSDNAAATLRDGTPDDGRLRVVPNGVEVARFADAAPLAAPFGEDVFVVAFSGLFYPWHGVPLLAQAFLLARTQRPRLRLLLIGDGEDAPLVRARLAPAGDDAVITGLVPRSEVPRRLAAADALATAHVGDAGFIGSPIKVWEYMAAGRPIVATRVAQLEEALSHERTALLVVPDDPQAFAGALVRLHDDPALGARIGAAAQAEARARHSWDARLADTLRH